VVEDEEMVLVLSDRVRVLDPGDQWLSPGPGLLATNEGEWNAESNPPTPVPTGTNAPDPFSVNPIASPPVPPK
jgi:hypothetical protein